MSQIQTVKTAIHEMAHQKLHDAAMKQQSLSQEMETISRNGKEVEAESVAYTVCQHYGLNTSEYSFAYIAGWSQGKETPKLKASLNTIRRVASEMVQDIDYHIRELEQEREGKAEIRADMGQENKKKSLLENLHEKQEMVKENFKAQCKSQSKEIE